MRSIPNPWNKILTQLGFPRKQKRTRRCAQQSMRSLRIESLEDRRLLAVDVFLDFTNFDLRLNELTATAGVESFDPLEEVPSLKDEIQRQLKAIYDDFEVAFYDTPLTGIFDTLTFGKTATAGNLGSATTSFPDFRNLDNMALADIYTANFSSFLNEFSDDANRSLQMDQLATSLAGTAAHELGHTFGLDHYDPYGDPGINPLSTGGIQNTHIMATGNTGISEIERESLRTLSPFSEAKLEFSNLLTDSPRSSDHEQAGSHETPAAAQNINLGASPPLPISGLRATNVIGELTGSGELDLYSFSGLAGQLLTTNVLSNKLSPVGSPSAFDTIVTVYDTNGTTALGTNNDLFWSPEAFGTGTLQTANINGDSMLLNVRLPSDGTYYIQVSGDDGSFGDYELFSTISDDIAPFITSVTIGSTSTLESYVVPTGDSTQLQTIDVRAANTITLTFDQAIDPTTLAAATLNLRNLVDASVTATTFTGFDSDTNQATWQVASGILGAGQWEVILPDTITNTAGVVLDGDWNNPTIAPNTVGLSTQTGTSTVSGNGFAGGDFRFYFTVLPGDFDRDNDVDINDFGVFSGQFGQTGAGLTADFNNDGDVDINDFGVFDSNLDKVFTILFGDFNDDGDVDINDFGIFSSQFGESGPGWTADFENDGDVDINDFGVFVANFGLGT